MYTSITFKNLTFEQFDDEFPTLEQISGPTKLKTIKNGFVLTFNDPTKCKSTFDFLQGRRTWLGPIQMYFGDDSEPSNSEKVYDFTLNSFGNSLPTTPCPMSSGDVTFITRMVLEELMELVVTIPGFKEDPKEVLKGILEISRFPPVDRNVTETVEIIAEQADALVDMIYYMENAGSKMGWNLQEIFDEVHKANMSKKWEDGEFHRDQHGKVIKPKHWKEPDIVSVIKKQISQGTWNHK